MNVLFDLDGTLTDPKDGILACFKHALDGLEAAIPPDSELQQLIGPPLQESFCRLIGVDRPDAVKHAVSRYRERFTARGIFENRIYPGIEDALARLLATNFSMYVATSKPKVFAERIVEHFGLTRCFCRVYGSELDCTNADKMELIAHILRSESLAAEKTIMIGDRSHDMVGAKSNGVFAVGALWGYGSKEELVASGATRLCATPADLPQVLESLNADDLETYRWK
jgi:phosphoglycolate phosphatase